MMKNETRIAISLLVMRLAVFLVMFMWTIDKFLRPDHASGVFQNFYGTPGFESQISYLLGTAELVLLIGFVIGVKKRLSYGIVLILHAISTFSSYKQYINPFEGPNLLFFAAWPMLASCLTLYLLRDQDTLFSVSKGPS